MGLAVVRKDEAVDGSSGKMTAQAQAMGNQPWRVASRCLLKRGKPMAMDYEPVRVPRYYALK